MKVIKKPTDPIATRISLGGRPDLGNYLVYRGKIEEVKEILMAAIIEIDNMDHEPEVDYSEDMP